MTGVQFFEDFEAHHRALLADQDAGACAFYVLVDEHDSAIVGRLNLYDLRENAARVGYRVAERVTGSGVATWLCSSFAGSPGKDTACGS